MGRDHAPASKLGDRKGQVVPSLLRKRIASDHGNYGAARLGRKADGTSEDRGRPGSGARGAQRLLEEVGALI